MKIALIGGSSFIGQKLISYLLKKNFNITATYKNNLNIKNKIKKIRWKSLDFSKKRNYFKYLNSPDVVINLSWPDIPYYHKKKHLKTYKLQKEFNQNLIKNGLKNLIITGTCYEYGKVKGETSENRLAKPVVTYGVAKLKLLKSILKLQKSYKFNFTWLRPFYVYGKNKKRKTLFSLINTHKIINQTLSVKGSLVRDFIPVDFLCKIIVKIIVKNKGFGVLNVCSGKGISVKKFILKNIRNKKNLKKINMNGKNPNSFEPNHFWGNTKKLIKVLSLRKSFFKF